MADGVPTPSITWLKDGAVISLSVGKKYTLQEGVEAGGLRDNINETAISMITMTHATRSDSGLYVCTATNKKGLGDVIDVPFNLSVIPVLPLNYCGTKPCLNGATCESGATTFLCKCTANFKGMICDEGHYNLLQFKHPYTNRLCTLTRHPFVLFNIQEFALSLPLQL